MRQQHYQRNIWMAHAVSNIALKKRWANLFAISAVTVVAFISVSFALWQIGLDIAQTTI